MSVDSLMIFAAGLGTRMGHLTATQPKPMIPVAGRPLLDYALTLAQQAAVKTVVVNTHYLSDQITAHLPQGVHSIFEPDILETGGGLKNALGLLGGGAVYTLNSDAVWTGDNPLTLLADHWDPDRMDGLLALVPKECAREYRGAGDFNLHDQRRISRRGDATSAPYVYTGAQIIKTDLLQQITQTKFSLNLLWDQMLADQRLCGVVHQGGWVDVGHPAGITAAEKMLEDTDV
ncbi:nucleotidyltransferase [Amylibacter marinus]|uniref:Nucleotidyltransferase n=1 Tax=Amylibacter marinus TaxID=1475483 RepID=A0ABQ5VWL2_9RHOB|nr:nucleotidyltransferase family protein [Amylibacter marinus]GLQ35616.1 nucleotidyltransferase [Amylibacter marinus]